MFEARDLLECNNVYEISIFIKMRALISVEVECSGEMALMCDPRSAVRLPSTEAPQSVGINRDAVTRGCTAALHITKDDFTWYLQILGADSLE